MPDDVQNGQKNLFLFDFHESYLMFFLVLAFLSALSQEINPHILPKKQFGGFLKRSDTGTLNVGEVDYAQKLFKYLILTGVICAVFYSLSIWVIYPYLVSRRIILVGRYAVAGEEQKASQTLKSILLHPSFLQDDVIIGVKDTVFDVYNKIKPSTINKIVTMLLEEIPSVVAQRPSHYPLLVSEVQLRLLSAEWDKTALEKARLAGEKLIQIAPQFPSSYLVNAYVYLASKDYQQALEATNTALNFNSNLAEAHYLLGVIYENLNDSEKSYAEYLQALYNGFAFNNLNTIVKLLNLFQKYQNYEAMALLYEQAITLKIPTPDDYLVLIKLFGKIGNQEKVNFYTTKLNQIISNN